ncbi:hypothetical protein CCACVL1_15840 [Corchorus capsularis]|uniref:Uncharacterized protein n=1 Tax=Corchorus capsularis TaxID=210143 RepID=A0A1R3I0W2_COCAP|nr:hypothetical protein CCACVL1_15840 [Corchorus capsularis]
MGEREFVLTRQIGRVDEDPTNLAYTGRCTGESQMIIDFKEVLNDN